MKNIFKGYKSRGCRRRGQASDMSVIVQAVEEELNGSGSIIGYRSMHQRLTAEHRLIVTRNTVRQVLKILDPEGVQARSRHRLRRRNYSTKGPNYLWHMDGWDKLKPFGFAVHGSIDGYSRKILWLEVCNSNNDPRIIKKYYLDYVRQVGGTSRIIRADRGTENGNVAAIHASGVLDFRLDRTALWVGGLRKVGINLQLRHIGLHVQEYRKYSWTEISGHQILVWSPSLLV